MSNIDFKSFLDAAFGLQDCDSGYGAVMPRSRDIRSFFEGRHGSDLPTRSVFIKPLSKDYEIVQDGWEKSLEGIRDDLEFVSEQITLVLKNTKNEKKEKNHDQN